MSTLEPSAGPATNAQLRRERLAAVAQSYGAAIVLVLFLIMGSVAFPTFPTLNNFANIATQSSFLLIVSVGMTFVILTGGIDLSVGSVFALGGVLAAYGSQLGVFAGLGLPLLVCGTVGLLQGLLIAYAKMAPFIVTLAGLLGVRGLVLATTNSGSTTPLVTDPAMIAIGQGGIAGRYWWRSWRSSSARCS